MNADRYIFSRTDPLCLYLMSVASLLEHDYEACQREVVIVKVLHPPRRLCHVPQI